MIPPRPVVAAPDTGYAAAGAFAGPERRGRDAARSRRQGRAGRDAGRRRHRLGQDRGLFRGGRRGAGQGQAGADPAAGNRADPRFPRAIPGPVRRKAGRMAFGPAAEDARTRLAAGRRGQRQGGRRRALGALPAVPATRADRRRRGARPRLQAGGPRLLQRPRHGGGARAHRRLPGGAGLGHAVDRKPGQRRPGPLRPRRAAGALCRSGAARHQGDRPAPRAAGARRLPVAGPAVGKSGRRSSAASSRCSSSTGAAMRR